MPKLIFLTLVLIIIIAGISYLVLKPAESPTEERDEISVFLLNLKKETKLNFSAVSPAQFQWILSVEPGIQEIVIEGKGFEVKNVPAEEENNIKEFLKNKDFIEDSLNIAAGTVSELKGYKKGKIVCLLVSGASGYKEATGQWIPPEPNKRDIEIRCGEVVEVALNEKKENNSEEESTTSGCCGGAAQEAVCTSPSGKSMKINEARQIAAASQCTEKGSLQNVSMCNENTGTWWINLELENPQQGCSPACVVDIEKKTAEINWRCTGLLPR